MNSITNGAEHRLSICQITTRYQGLEEDVRSYQKAGIDGISLWWDSLQDYGIENAVRLLEDADFPAISIVGVPFMVSPEKMTAKEAFDGILRGLDACVRVGCGAVGVVPGNRNGRSIDEMERLTVEVLTRLAPEAAARNVTLMLEPIHAPYFDFLNTLADADRLVRKVNHPNVKILFDVWHLCHEPELFTRIDQTIDRIGFVHFSDWREPTRYHDDRMIPGEGVLPLRDILRKLDQAGYRGPYDVEIFSEEIWRMPSEEVLGKCLLFFDSVWK